MYSYALLFVCSNYCSGCILNPSDNGNICLEFPFRWSLLHCRMLYTPATTPLKSFLYLQEHVTSKLKRMEDFNQPFPQREESGLFRNLEINEQGNIYIEETSKWARFLSIIGFIVLFFALIGGLGVMMASSAAVRSTGMPFSGAILGLFYIIMALLYFFPSFYLYKFGSLARKGIQTENISDLNEGLRYLKNFFRFTGILVIVIIGFYIIVLLAFGMGAMTSRF